MAYLKSISYLIFETAKAEEWRTYASDFLGMEVREQADGSLKVRMDEHAYRFIIRPGSGEGLFAAGFQVLDRDALRAFERHLQAKGVEYVRATDEEISERQVQDMIWFHDPEGLRLEVVCCPLIGAEPPQLPLIPGGFVTGNGG